MYIYNIILISSSFYLRYFDVTRRVIIIIYTCPPLPTSAEQAKIYLYYSYDCQYKRRRFKKSSSDDYDFKCTGVDVSDPVVERPLQTTR